MSGQVENTPDWSATAESTALVSYKYLLKVFSFFFFFSECGHCNKVNNQGILVGPCQIFLVKSLVEKWTYPLLGIWSEILAFPKLSQWSRIFPRWPWPNSDCCNSQWQEVTCTIIGWILVISLFRLPTILISRKNMRIVDGWVGTNNAIYPGIPFKDQILALFWCKWKVKIHLLSL